MPRPKDDGLKYFPFDVTFFRDHKIRALFGKYGHKGIVTYMYLLCEIYGNYGYYLPLDEDVISCIAADLNLSENLTKQIIAYLFSRSLLDGKLAESVNVLSAKSIQRRYQEAKKGLKRNVFVKATYWLLEKAETLGFIKVCHKDGLTENYEDKSENYSDKSEKNDTKESKGKENKLKESKASPLSGEVTPASEKKKPVFHKFGEYKHVKLTEEQYQKLIADFGEQKIAEYIRRIDEYVQLHKNKRYDDYNLAIRNWIKNDGNNKTDAQNNAGHSSFNAEDVEKAVMGKYKRLGGKKDDG